MGRLLPTRDQPDKIVRRQALGLGVLASLFALISRSAARAADALTIDPNGKVNIDNLSVQKSLAVAGAMKIEGKNALEFGADIPKQVSAGQIAYQKHSGNALDIVGAGATAPERRISMWAEGGATLNGSLTVSDDATLKKSLTVAGNAELKTPAGANTLDVQSAVRVSEANHPKGLALYVTANSDPDGKGVEFRHSNGSQGIGIGYNSIYATGSNTNQDLILKARGTGRVRITGTLQAEDFAATGIKATTINGEKPPYAFEIGNKADTTNWHAVQVPSDIIKSYLGDADGGTIKLLFRVNNTDEVRVITETVYIEQPDKSNNRSPGLHGWTRQLGGGDSAFILGTAAKYEIIPTPWNWMYVCNYPTLPSGQSGADTRHAPGNAWTGTDQYKLEFLTPPNVSATVLIYDR